MKYIKQLLVGLVLMAGFVFVPQTAGAVNLLGDACSAGNSTICDDQDVEAGGIIKNIVNVLLYILGAVSVIVIIIGGIMYTVSGGDSAGTKRAKDTILYAVIGLLVAIFAYAIVNWLLEVVTGTSANP